MEWLYKVSQHHEEWIKYINKMGNCSHAEDLVQEMYLRLVQYDRGEAVILPSGKVRKSYIWTVLYNIFIDYHKSASKFSFVQVEDCIGLQVEQQDNQLEDAYERIMQKMFREIDQLDIEGYPYNKELFNLYAESAMSMRCISSITKISLTSIFNTLKQCREHLSDELREDIEDFYNGEYELIK